MVLKKLPVLSGKGLKTNCYIIADQEKKEGIVVDPGGEPHKIINMVNILGIRIKYIVLTHCHADHILAVPDVKTACGGKVILSREESEFVNNNSINLVNEIKEEDISIEVDARIDDGDLLHIGDIEFEVISTPGHTKGSVCLYCAQYKFVLSGDTLFNGTWGRTDLPTSSFESIIASITNKLMILPEKTIVYPGHGKSTIIREEEKVYLNLQPKRY